MLQVTNYKKSYGSIVVLSIAHLQLNTGIHWLKGENGAGKTTFLKSIAGLIPFEGDVAVNDISLRKQRMLYTRQVSFAEAEPVYPAFLTGNDLLQFYSKTKGDNEQRVNAIIKRFGMKTYLKNKVGTYSSGMQKKLSLLLSFAGHPSWILLDEPFVTLDVEAVNTLQELIVSCQQEGASFLISSHQPVSLSKSYQTLSVQQQTIQPQTYAAPVE